MCCSDENRILTSCGLPQMISRRGCEKQMPSYESSLEKLAKARAKGRRLALMGLFLFWNNERF